MFSHALAHGKHFAPLLLEAHRRVGRRRCRRHDQRIANQMAKEAADYRTGDSAAHACINFCALGRFSMAASVVDNYDTGGGASCRARGRAQGRLIARSSRIFSGLRPTMADIPVQRAAGTGSSVVVGFRPEIGLLLIFLMHVYKTVTMFLGNQQARPVGYAVKKAIMSVPTQQKSSSTST